MIFLPGFNYSLWKYDYSGRATRLLTLMEKIDDKVKIHYSTEFRIDSTETHLALIRGTIDREDYAIVVKDLNTRSDSFILSIKEIEKRNPDLMQSISF